MRVTVCQFPDDQALMEDVWAQLVAFVRQTESTFVLLPEMPFFPWSAGSSLYQPAVFEMAVESHDRWMGRLAELAPATVASSRPVLKNGLRLNEGFIWDEANGYRGVHCKYYLPEEPDFWEATWFDRGEKNFKTVPTPLGEAGFLICTELWFNEHARAYGHQQARLLLCPRATRLGTRNKWLVGGRAGAIASGAWCLSSNRGGQQASGEAWAGAGWIIEPEAGGIKAITSEKEPFVTVDIDLELADKAKSSYPRYVLE